MSRPILKCLRAWNLGTEEVKMAGYSSEWQMHRWGGLANLMVHRAGECLPTLEKRATGRAEFDSKKRMVREKREN